MRNLILKNIRNEFHNRVDFLFELEKINQSIFKNRIDVESKSYFLLVSGFIERIKGLFFLLNLNYTDENKLITINFQNCDGVNILLRGALESVVVMRLLLDNSDLSEKYFNQKNLDKSDIITKFNGSSKYFSRLDPKDVSSYNRYGWINSIIDKKVITLDDLIKATNYDEDTKAYYIGETLHNNNLSHPILKNDSVILDGMFGSGNVNEIIYFFEILTNLTYDLIRNIVEFDQKHLNGANLLSISKIRFMPEIKDYNTVLVRFDYKMHSKYDETKKLLSIRKKEYDTSVSHADNLQSWVLVYLLGLKGIQDSKPRLFKTMDKYLESLMINIQELVIAFESNKTQIFFTKSRYVLELISTIDLLIDFDEAEMEVYQAHTDVLRYSAWNKIPKIMKERLRDAGILNEDPNKVKINYQGKDITIFDLYLNNLKFLKSYYNNKYGINLGNGQLKHVNGWAINLVDKRNKAPSNLSLILGFIDRNHLEFHGNKDNTKDYIRGLYTLICSYCHATSFATHEIINQNEELYVDEAYYYSVKIFDVLMKRLESKFPSIVEAKNYMYKSKSHKNSLSYEYSIDQILKIYKKSVIIK